MIGRPIDGKRNGKPGYSEQRNECSKAPTLIEVGLDSTALKLIHSGLRADVLPGAKSPGEALFLLPNECRGETIGVGGAL
jgi:hypothetical protein